MPWSSLGMKAVGVLPINQTNITAKTASNATGIILRLEKYANTCPYFSVIDSNAALNDMDSLLEKLSFLPVSGSCLRTNTVQSTGLSVNALMAEIITEDANVKANCV